MFGAFLGLNHAENAEPSFFSDLSDFSVVALLEWQRRSERVAANSRVACGKCVTYRRKQKPYRNRPEGYRQVGVEDT